MKYKQENIDLNDPTLERRQFICKVCNQEKTKIRIGYFADKINKKWVEPDGSTLNGAVCGHCHRERIKNNMAKLKEKRREIKVPISED